MESIWVDIAVKKYRIAHPKSRVVGRYRYSRNGAITHQKQCIFCGERGPSWCANWPKTVQATKWEEEHECSEIKDYVDWAT